MFSRQLHSLFPRFPAWVLKYGVGCLARGGRVSPVRLAPLATGAVKQGRWAAWAALEPSRGGVGLWGCDHVLLFQVSELPVSCFTWEETSLVFQASYPFFFFAKQEHVWDLNFFWAVSRC